MIGQQQKVAPVDLEIVWETYESRVFKGVMRQRPLDIVNHDKERRWCPPLRDSILAMYGVTIRAS